MAPSIEEIVNSNRPNLDSYIELYKHFHANPELSHNERETAAKIAATLSTISSDFKIHTKIGGHGLVAVMTNGEGKTVLMRADMDGLPVKEATGLPYASTKKMKDASLAPDHPDAQREKPVMHACGHDFHITAMLAAADTLSKCRDKWTGTLILLFQPAEEKGDGARIMIADNLYARIGHTPDILLGSHVMPHRAGYIGSRRSLMATSADSLEITLHGRGGHASQPHAVIDPVLMASHTVLALQSIVSREISPADHGVVTIASVQAGDAENVTPETAKLKVDMRALNPRVRAHMIESVKRIVTAQCASFRSPKDPDFQTIRIFPLLHNDDSVTSQLEGSFTSFFGTGTKEFDQYSAAAPMLTGSEDFGELATAIDKPSCYWVYGGTSQEVWDGLEAKGELGPGSVPINHSDRFAPVIMPTLKVATDANCVAALTFLGK